MNFWLMRRSGLLHDRYRNIILYSAPAMNFAIGYHRIHPNVSLNYQMNRFSTGAPEMIAEMLEVAPKIRDYTDYIREFLDLADRALRNGELLKGAWYVRSAEFFMFPDDLRKQSARAEFVRLMRDCFAITA